MTKQARHLSIFALAGLFGALLFVLRTILLGSQWRHGPVFDVLEGVTHYVFPAWLLGIRQPAVTVLNWTVLALCNVLVYVVLGSVLAELHTFVTQSAIAYGLLAMGGPILLNASLGDLPQRFGAVPAFVLALVFWAAMAWRAFLVLGRGPDRPAIV